MEVSMGSNVIRNTNGVLKVEGKDQILLEIENNSRLLLTMDIYDAKEIHIAKIIRNNFAFDYKDRYKLIAKPSSLILVNRDHNSVLIEASIQDFMNKKLEVVRGTFYSWKAHLVEITPRYWRIMGTTIGGTVFDCHGGAIIVGK